MKKERIELAKVMEVQLGKVWFMVHFYWIYGV